MKDGVYQFGLLGSVCECVGMSYVISVLKSTGAWHANAGRESANTALLGTMSKQLNTAELAAEAFRAVQLASCHDECLAALHQLQLLCSTQPVADQVAGMGWFQSLQHLLQAAPVTLGEGFDLSRG